jgi:hypothetical protein
VLTIAVQVSRRIEVRQADGQKKIAIKRIKKRRKNNLGVWEKGRKKRLLSS